MNVRIDDSQQGGGHPHMRQRQGQSTAELAVLIAVVIAAVLAMQIYVKRAAMGKLRSAADQVGDQVSPLSTNYTSNQKYNSTKNENTTGGNTNAGNVSITGISENQTRTGGENITTGLNGENLF